MHMCLSRCAFVYFSAMTIGGREGVRCPGQELCMVIAYTMWILGTELGFSAIAATALSGRASFPALNIYFIANITSFNAMQHFF